MFWMRALVCTPSVTMPACAPVSDTAGIPRECSAMAVKAMVVCSPVASRTSISRSLGRDMSSLAILIRLSVTPLMAETTTKIWSPLTRYLATRAATFLMRSGLPTEVPPYFWTINAINSKAAFRARHPSPKVLYPDHHGRALDRRQFADPLQRPGDRPIRRVVEHENQRDARAFVALGLYHRGNADVGRAEDGGDLGQHPGPVDDIDRKSTRLD